MRRSLLMRCRVRSRAVKPSRVVVLVSIWINRVWVRHLRVVDIEHTWRAPEIEDMFPERDREDYNEG